MTIKTFFLASAAATVLTAAPALAQETQPAQAPATAPAAQPSLSLTPGSTVRGPDGDLGKLEGVRTNAEGKQELTVRGADGQLRGVPLAGIRQDGEAVAVAYTKADFDAAAPIAGAPAASEPTDPAAPPASDPSMTTPPTSEPTPPLPTDPATEPTTEPTEPTTPPTQPN